MSDDLRATIAVTLELHATTVSRELVECRCGWLVRRGPDATTAHREHLTDKLTQALAGQAAAPAPVASHQDAVDLAMEVCPGLGQASAEEFIDTVSLMQRVLQSRWLRSRSSAPYAPIRRDTPPEEKQRA